MGAYPGEEEEEEAEAVVVGDGLEREGRRGGGAPILLLRPRRREDLHEVAHRHPVRRQLQQRLPDARGSRVLSFRSAAADPREHVHGAAADEVAGDEGFEIIFGWGAGRVSGMWADGEGKMGHHFQLPI